MQRPAQMKKSVRGRGAEGTSRRREEKKERKNQRKNKRVRSLLSRRKKSSPEAMAKGCAVELAAAGEDQEEVLKMVRRPRLAGKGMKRKDLIHLLTRSQAMGPRARSKATEMQSLPGPRLEINSRTGRDLKETTTRLQGRKERKVSRGKRGDLTVAEAVEGAAEAVEEAAEAVVTVQPLATAPTPL